MSPSSSSESDEDYRPDIEEEAISSVYEDTPVKDACLGSSSDAPLPKRLVHSRVCSIDQQYIYICSVFSCYPASCIVLISACLPPK